MKEKIITLIIGILIGAVITAGVFLIVKPGSSRKTPDFSQFSKNGERPNMENFDPSNFKSGEGRSRRSKDDTSKDTEKKVDDSAKTGDTTDEKQS